MFHDLPKKKDGSSFTLDDIEGNEKQQQVVYTVLSKLKEWIEFPKKYASNKKLKFSPLHMTVMGVGGTGKSFLISVLVTAIRKLFHDEDILTTIINAPTGAAAYNVNGKTCHSTWSIPIKKGFELSDEKAAQMRHELRRILFLCIDERSMLSKAILGSIDRNSRKTVLTNEIQSEKRFGGIPIVLLCGDDHQLPSVTIGEEGQGIMYYFRTQQSSKDRNSQTLATEKHGEGAFFKCAQNVVRLNKIKRLESNAVDLKRILNDVRNGGMSKEDAEFLMKRHIRHVPFEKRQWLEQNAVYLFATKQLKEEHNMRKLNEITNSTNPVLLLQTKFEKCNQSLCKTAGNKKHFDSDSTPSRSILCIGAKVAIENRNFQPNWGLYNGALGTVVGIKFAKGENPQTGHLPRYVVVDFPHYSGPPWIDDHPTYVPIPTVEIPCNRSYNCCTARFIPLCLAFARTIHKFQGMEAGPSKHIPAIVVDVGSIKFEAVNPGLLYTALSRASTLGDDSLLNSAIYLSGPVTIDRLMNVKYLRTKNNTTQVYQKVEMRDKWILFLLQQEEKTPTISTRKMTKLKEWASTTKITTAQLDEIILFHKKHCWKDPDPTVPLKD